MLDMVMVNFTWIRIGFALDTNKSMRKIFQLGWTCLTVRSWKYAFLLLW